MPIVFCLLPILIIFFFLIYFTSLFWQEGFDLGKVLLLFTFIIIIFYPLYSRLYVRILDSKPSKIKIPKISFITSLFWTSFGISCLTILLLGIPLLSSDVNVAKTGVSKFPLLIRFFRLGIPYSLIVLSLLANLNLYSKKALKWKFILSFVIAPLYGFKGYILYIALPYIFHLSIEKYSKKKILLSGLTLSIVILLIVSYAEGISLLEGIPYIAIRATEVNLLGNTLAMEYSGEFQQLTPFISEIKAFALRIVGKRDIDVLQSLLFERYMGSNPYNMQVSISMPVEYYSLSSSLGLILFIAVYFLIYRSVRLLISSSSIYVVALGLLFLNNFYESIVNGLFFFKTIDFMFSITFITLFIASQHYIMKYHSKLGLK